MQMRPCRAILFQVLCAFSTCCTGAVLLLRGHMHPAYETASEFISNVVCHELHRLQAIVATLERGGGRPIGFRDRGDTEEWWYSQGDGPRLDLPQGFSRRLEVLSDALWDDAYDPLWSSEQIKRVWDVAQTLLNETRSIKLPYKRSRWKGGHDGDEPQLEEEHDELDIQTQLQTVVDGLAEAVDKAEAAAKKKRRRR